MATRSGYDRCPWLGGGWLWRGALAVVPALPFAVAACGGGDGDGTVVTAGRPSESAFTESTLTVKAGQQTTVTLDNKGTLAHQWQIAEGPLAGTSLPSEVAPGQRGTVTFTAPPEGTYRFICPMPGHADNGMTGRLVSQ